MPSSSPLALIILSAALLSGCSQGNIVNQEMVDQLRPGMTRSQVRYIFGTPLLMDTFDQDRWDYYYGIKPPGRTETRERITVFFEGNTLTHFSGDYLPTSLQTTEADDAVTAEALPSSSELETAALKTTELTPTE